MNLGYGFHVTIPDENSEVSLLNLLRRRKKNYPMVAKITPLPGYPVEYVVTSLDGIFLKLDNLGSLPSFDLLPVEIVDLEKI